MIQTFTTHISNYTLHGDVFFSPPATTSLQGDERSNLASGEGHSVGFKRTKCQPSHREVSSG